MFEYIREIVFSLEMVSEVPWRNFRNQQVEQLSGVVSVLMESHKILAINMSPFERLFFERHLRQQRGVLLMFVLF